MSIRSHLATARSLIKEKRYQDAIAEYEYVLDLDPGNPEAVSGLEKLSGAAPLANGSLARDPSEARIKTDFFAREAAEISAPILKQAPVRVVMAVIIGGLLFGIYQALTYFLNYEKLEAMKNVAVRLERPVIRGGEAYLNLEVQNYNPAPVRNATLSYGITSSTGSEIASGKVAIVGVVPAGDSRSFTNLRLGAISGQAGRMHAELSDLGYGPKPQLSADLQAKFVEAAQMPDKEAVAAYKYLVEQAPQFVPAYVGLGQALAASDRLDLAAAAYKKALAIDPGSYNAHYNLGVALFYQGDPAAARRELEKAQALEPNDPSLAVRLRQLAEKPGQGAVSKGAAVKPGP